MYLNYFLFVLWAGFMVYGLSNSVLSSMWTTYAGSIGADVALIGVITLITNLSSGTASALSYNIRKKIGNNFSVVLGMISLSISMVLFFISKDIMVLYVAVIFNGFGCGIIDTIANGFVVRYHSAKDVSYLHACWGLGSTLAPILMSFAIMRTDNFRNGYVLNLAIIIIMIVVLLLIKGFWENKKKSLDEETVKEYTISKEEKENKNTILAAFKIKYGVLIALCFFLGNGINGTLSSWISTIVIGQNNVDATVGASACAYFFGALTVTRILIGILASKASTRTVVRFGLIVTGLGLLLLFVKNSNLYFIYFVAIVLGVGIAPIMPFLDYTIKEVFGKNEVSILVSACSVMSLLGYGISSAIMSGFVKIFTIQYAQIFLIILLIILTIIYSYIIKMSDIKNKK